MTKRLLNIGPEDTVNEIDTNADGKPDVRVITDNFPQNGIEVIPDPPPVEDPPPEVRLSVTEFDAVAHWHDGYRAMTDDPRHPLSHLKDA